MKILCILGTRPEAIKMAPVISLLKNNSLFDVSVCVTSQHREMLTAALNVFGIIPDFDLGIMLENQSIFDISSAILNKIEPVLKTAAPDLIMVQGDTTSAFIGALAGFYFRVKIAHIEAGLRTFNRHSPFPEEMNRQLISRMADIHFVPSPVAKENLIRENVAESTIFLTGNTGTDALKYALVILESKERSGSEAGFPIIPESLFSGLKDSTKKLILVTGHRRESFGAGIENICNALLEAAKRSDVLIAMTVHPNPNIMGTIERLLSGQKNICLLEPLDYLSFVYLMTLSNFIITDSGGIQEEAPYLGKPVLVTRENTERMEPVISGTAKLTGIKVSDIVNDINMLLDNKELYQSMTRSHLPYGDGKAAEKIVEILAGFKS
jgi:UDP-N-acetylglucosamine 2-epimerase (non-hydrolysing)